MKKQETKSDLIKRQDAIDALRNGKRYGCCDKLKNCTRCIKKNGWEE